MFTHQKYLTNLLTHHQYIYTVDSRTSVVKLDCLPLALFYQKKIVYSLSKSLTEKCIYRQHKSMRGGEGGGVHSWLYVMKNYKPEL